MAMEIKRIYKGTDSKMSSKIHSSMNFFKIHLADFTAYDPHLDINYLNHWQAAGKLAGSLFVVNNDEHETFLDELKIKESNKALEKCRAKYKDVKYFAGKAFPDNKEAMKEFGEGAYSKVCNSRFKMVPFMETLFGVASKYKVLLIAQNFSQAAIDEIATLATELSNDNKAQQLKKKERPTETRKRIEALNRFYSFGQKVSEAAQEVYRYNDLLRDDFRLAHRHHPKVTKSWFVLGNASVRKTALKKLLKKFIVTMTNQSKETVLYWQANNINEMPLQKHSLAAGDVIAVEAQNPEKKFIVVQNTSAKTARIMFTKEKWPKPEFG